MSKLFDRYASFVFFIIGAAFVYGSTTITKSAYGSNVGPNVFPFVLGLVLLLLSVKLFFETLRYPEEQKSTEKLDYKRFGIIFISAVIYCLILEPIGYVISTFLFLLVAFMTMDKDKWWKSAIIAAAFAIGVYVLFVVILEGSLPGFPEWLGL